METTLDDQLQSLMAEAQERSDAKRALESHIQCTEEEIAMLQSERSEVSQRREAEEIELALTLDSPPIAETENERRIAELNGRIRFLQVRARGLRFKLVPIGEELRAISQRADDLNTTFCKQVLAGFVEDYMAAAERLLAMTCKAIAIVRADGDRNTNHKFPMIQAAHTPLQVRHPISMINIIDLSPPVAQREIWKHNADAVALHDAIVANRERAVAIIRLANGEPGAVGVR